MDRNTENHFAYLPETEIGRSKFERNFTHKTTFNTGDLFPIDWQEILPGDTVKMDMSSLVRLQTPIAPVMDNLYLDTYWFFVPNRLLWSHWVNFMGENTNEWTQKNKYTIPQLVLGGWDASKAKSKVDKRSIANYLGIPIGLGDVSNGDDKDYTIKVNHLPFRAYCKIWNDWFRSTPTQKELYFSLGDGDTNNCNRVGALTHTDPYTEYCYRGGACAKANKFHDVFTSCLPEPQEGPATLVPLVGEAPVLYGKSIVSGEFQDTDATGKKVFLESTDTTDGTANARAYTPDELAVATNLADLTTTNTTLIADLQNAIGASVAAIRQSFAIQRFYEKTARGGNRYIEQIQSHFATTNPDFRLQRSEYLGGATRIPISINQVIQTVSDASEPLGNTGAYSVTSDVSTDMWTRSFTEHGILMCLGVARTDHSYQQGIAKKFFKKSIFDYYWPELANLSEVPVYNKEIFAQEGSSDNISTNDEVFGYQEAWSEYRYEKDIITGELSSMYSQSEDIWHYGDYYTECPTLNAEWIRETDVNVKRTLAYQDGDQFIGDFYIRGTWTRPMPLYSVPGLIDHH